MLLVSASCNNSKERDTIAPQPPKALEDKTSSFDIASKSGRSDLLESLYYEMSGNTPELEAFENKLERLAKSKDDSTASFDTYVEKNQSYFESADGHIGQIKDSVLKERMKGLIAGNLATYNAGISKHKELLDIISKKDLSLNDLHIVLKITRTLPLMKKYQADKLPAAKSIEGYLHELDGALKTADTLIKK
jgi:hypothetical protein